MRDGCIGCGISKYVMLSRKNIRFENVFKVPITIAVTNRKMEMSMQNHMTLERRNVGDVERRWPLTVFWAIALLGIGILIGAAGDTGQSKAPVLTPVSDTKIEDWHGNVRRGG